jgi:anti-sigma B factor antagonist
LPPPARYSELPYLDRGDNLVVTRTKRMNRFDPLEIRNNAHMAAITTQTSGEILVVGFTDSKILDSQRIEQVGKELQEVVRQAVHKKLLVNFGGVSFMSSAMITKLVMLNKACKAQGIALKFCDVSANVMEVFKITKLNKLFDIQDKEEKAIASFDKKGWFG